MCKIGLKKQNKIFCALCIALFLIGTLRHTKNVFRLGYVRTFTLYAVLSGDTLLINCKTMSNARATSPDGYSECGYTKPPSDTCTSFTLGLLV